MYVCINWFKNNCLKSKNVCGKCICSIWHIFTNQSMWYTILTNWKIKTNRCRESLWQNSTPICDKNSPESRHRRNISQHNKSHIRQTHSKHFPQWWKIESTASKIRNKAKVPSLTTTSQHSFGSPSHSSQRTTRNKRDPGWKMRSKTLTVCRWHDPLHRKL